MNDRYLIIENVTKAFTSGKSETQVLSSINLKVRRGEYISIIGHSGCGKSTLLNVVAGLTQATSGNVILDGKEVNEPGPDRSVVFQNHSLLPWLTVYENVALAVDKVFGKRKSATERRQWAEHNLSKVGMDHALNRLPSEISGGMKQRVGIARALAMEPKVLLLDEPFGALDALTRAHLQDEVMRIHADLGTTVLMITHDVDEAVLLSDRIVMMTNGPAATIGEILTIDLERPRNRLDLSDNPHYNHLRHEVLRFLYEKQRKVEPMARAPSVASTASTTSAASSSPRRAVGSDL
jgi:nitrate/nitrite transport system ATP-binding protein